MGHHGVDFALPQGTPVLAAASGTVVQAGNNGEYGLSITLEHRWGTSLYAHLEKSLVTLGAKVHSGKQIGVSGDTGTAYGPHLHFGIRPSKPDLSNGYLGFINPQPYITSRFSKSDI